MPVGAFVEKFFSAHIKAKKKCLFGGLRALITQRMHVFRDKHANSRFEIQEKKIFLWELWYQIATSHGLKQVLCGLIESTCTKE